jgi:hypothetical protein
VNEKTRSLSVPKTLARSSAPIEQSPLLIQNLLPFGGLGRQRDLEKSGALDRDANPVFVEDAGRFAHLFDGLRGVVRPPDVAHFGPFQSVLAQELGRGQDVIVDFVGGYAEV